MTYYSPRCNGCKDLQKTRRMKEQTIAICYSRLFSQILEENEEPDLAINCERLGRELEDKVFLICILPEKTSADI